MTNLLFVAFSLSSVLLPFHLCQEQQCPSIYRRYSQTHSCSQPKNSDCPIFQSLVGPEEIQQILDAHNQYRNLVATGKEDRSGGLPQAADMMQMVWDPELATIAQRRVEQCQYEHDCVDCRRVENFPVGQNIGRIDFTCNMSAVCNLNSTSNWFEIIKMFTDEVTVFDQKYLKSLQLPPERVFGHFTQVIWSKTWRIGCGYVAYKNGTGYGQFYVCNYGPGGNILKKPVYEIGLPCSACPVNSCCGKTCNSTEYPGLCKMNNNSEAPIYPRNDSFIFYCDFQSTARNCSNLVLGSNKWRFINALGGAYEEIVLNGGETTTLKLSQPMTSKQGLCLRIRYRFGPTIDGNRKSVKARLTFEAAENKRSSIPPRSWNLPSPSHREFFDYSMDMNFSYDILVSIVFSVPAKDSPQFFHIQHVTAVKGKCKK